MEYCVLLRVWLKKNITLSSIDGVLKIMPFCFSFTKKIFYSDTYACGIHKSNFNFSGDDMSLHFFHPDSNRLTFCLLSNSKNFPFVIQYAIYPSLKTGYLLRTDAMLMLLLLLLASDGHFKNSPLNFNNIALVKALPDIKILSR